VRHHLARLWRSRAGASPAAPWFQRGARPCDVVVGGGQSGPITVGAGERAAVVPLESALLIGPGGCVPAGQRNFRRCRCRCAGLAWGSTGSRGAGESVWRPAVGEQRSTCTWLRGRPARQHLPGARDAVPMPADVVKAIKTFTPQPMAGALRGCADRCEDVAGPAQPLLRQRRQFSFVAGKEVRSNRISALSTWNGRLSWQFWPGWYEHPAGLAGVELPRSSRSSGSFRMRG